MQPSDVTSGASRFVSRIAAEWPPGAPPWDVRDATLVFVDISGFTNLSERLARRGRIGAEELTEVLDRVFGSMLELAYERGGSLLKFGGDALLLFFSGDDRVAQACSAAVEMRASLREAARIPTSVGRVPLRMSIGVHDGPVHLFYVGASHKELIITGPAATETTAMEGAADAGEIVVSDTVVAALPRGATGAAKGPGRLLKWRTAHAEPSGPTARQPDTAPLTTLLSVGLRDHLGSARTESEHRSATIGFVKFKGVDALLATDGPPAVANALEQLIASVQHAVDAESVTFLATDLDADGGKVILAAGVPVAREDDDGRMLRAARSIVDSPQQLAVRVGVNRGHVFAGEIGTPFRATYTVMGDTVNLAARLMAAASAGEVYASPSVLDRARTRFETTALEPFAVKGKSEPVHAFAVGAEIGARTDVATDTLPFAGREAELAALRDLLQPRPSEVPQVVFIVGETGIGKTRLVAEAIAGLTDVERVVIRAEPYATATPYRAVRDPMRELLGVEPPDAPTLGRRVAAIAPELEAFAPLVGDVVGIDMPSTPEVDALDPYFRRDRLAEVVFGLVERVVDRPLVWIVDDAHWLDEASSHLLGRIGLATRDREWSIVATRTTPEGGFEFEGPLIELGALPDGVVERLVVDVTSATPLRPDKIAEIVARAGGSPLFLEELLRAVRSAGDADELPETLEAVVARQIDELAPLSRRLLRYAAVLGRSFRIELGERVLAEEEIVLDAATTDELASFIALEDGTYEFRHAMVRDVAYAGLPYRRRQALHLRAGDAAEALAGDDVEAVAEVLSMHFTLAGDHERAWRYAQLAAAKARDAFANVEAATHYRRALDAARRLDQVTDDERAELFVELGDVCERAAMFDAALDAYRAATRIVADDPIRYVSGLLKQARAKERAGAFVSALRTVNRGLALLDGRDDADAGIRRAQLAASAATIRWAQERSREALDEAERAIAAARAVGEQATLAQALMIADFADFACHGPNSGERTREALAIFIESRDLPHEAQARGNLGFLAATGSRWNEAIEWCTTARDLFDRCGDTVGVGIATRNLGEILVNQLRADEAEPLLRDAARVLRSVDYNDGAAEAEVQLARAWTLEGRYDDAEAALDRVTQELAAMGKTASEFDAALARANLLIRRREPAEALALLARAEKAAGVEAEQFVPLLALARAHAAAEVGDVELAENALAIGLEAARALPYEEGMLHLLADDIAHKFGRPADPAIRVAAETTLAGLGVRLRDRRAV